jgi:membrane protein
MLLRLTVEKASHDGIGLAASALAFVTILSLVPLLAVFLLLGARTYSRYQDKFLELLGGLLPYSEAALQTMLQDFLRQAENVRGIGLIFFVISALIAFTTVEGAINRTWGLPQQRPFRQRLQSFTLLLFWGSLLVGGAFSIFFTLGQEGGLTARWESNSFTGLLAPLLILAGMTMLYWLVPYTAVGFRHALLGGAVATVLLELLRRGFALYVEAFPGFQVVYGSFAFALFFMVSIQCAWWIVLAGNHLTYIAQHFDALAHTRRTGGRLPGPWLGLAAVMVLAQRLEAGKPIVAFQELVNHLRVPPSLLRQALGPLAESGLLQEAGAGMEAYILAGAPRQVKLDALFERYDPNPASFTDVGLPEQLETLRHQVIGARTHSLGELSLADLLDGPKPEAPAAPAETPAAP